MRGLLLAHSWSTRNLNNRRSADHILGGSAPSARSRRGRSLRSLIDSYAYEDGRMLGFSIVGAIEKSVVRDKSHYLKMLQLRTPSRLVKMRFFANCFRLP